ncbi:MAG: hypothetical protein Q9223_003155 [Gallowayella weberi]
MGNVEKIRKIVPRFESKLDHRRRWELKSLEFRISDSLDSFRKWMGNWFEDPVNPDISPKTLWGFQASITIKYLIDDVIQTSKVIEQQLSDVEIKPQNQPRPLWKQAMESVRHKQRNATFQKLYDHDRRLNDDLIHELWIVSDTAFESGHGLSTTEMEPSGSDQLLKFAYTQGPVRRSSCAFAPSKITAVAISKWTFIATAIAYAIIFGPTRFHLDGISAHFGSPRSSSTELKSEEPWRDHQSYQVNGSALYGNLDSKERIALAFKLTESTLYLLGTPWLCTLNSTNLRRLDSTDGGCPIMMLRSATLDLEDLLLIFELDEIAQLFQLGIVLMKLALGMKYEPEKREDLAMLDHHACVRERLHRLPEVERAMGLQYCKATAFCLQVGKGKYPAQGKYQGQAYGFGELDLAEILKDYIAQVFLRMQELHNASKSSDTNLETPAKPKRAPNKHSTRGLF